MIEWSYEGEATPDEIDSELEGFIYLITYTDGTKYIGKKNFFSKSTLPALKSGEQRPNSQRIGKNVGGKRKYFDIVYKENNWRKYTGSSKLTAGKEILKREILDICMTKRRLTYLEVYYLMIYKVLESDEYLNDNILGKFFETVNEGVA